MTARNHQFGLLLVVAAVTVLGSLAPVRAAENDGSLETMWAESTKTANSVPSEAPIKAASRALGAKVTEIAAKETGGSSEAKAICSVDSLMNSGTIVSGGWPGIGPFKASAAQPYDFSDATGNHLKLAVDNNQVSLAQIDLASSATPKETLIKLEVTTDFLLEGLGVKAAKINEFNLGFEKATARLKGPIVKPIGLLASPLAVLVRPSDSPGGNDSGPAKAMVSVIVNAAPASMIKHEEEPVEEKKTPHEEAKTNEPPQNNVEHNAPESQSTSPASPNISETAPAASEDSKKQFLAIIQNWQAIKKKALKDVETAELSQILAGKALAAQIEAIRWLKTHHKYCDVVPKGVSVEQLEEVLPEKKYAVHAVVKEITRYLDQNGGQLLKEINDTYNVVYTIEKINDQWLITDTAILKTAGASQAPKPHH